MIACKARFNWRRALCQWFAVFTALAAPSISAQDYLIQPPFGFDREVRDYSQRHLSDNVRFLLFHSAFTVTQTGYASNSGNLTNLVIATDFAQLAANGISGLARSEIDRDLYNAERFTVLLYESFARRWERMNPIPGLYYSLLIRSPAYPFIFMQGLDDYAWDFGTFPFTDDERFKQISLASRQYGFAFRILIY